MDMKISHCTSCAETAVDGLQRASDHGGVGPGDEGYKFGNLTGLSMPLDGHETVHCFGHWAVGRIHVAVGWPWLDRVNGDAPTAEITCEASDHPLHCRLGEGVGSPSRERNSIAVG